VNKKCLKNEIVANLIRKTIDQPNFAGKLSIDTSKYQTNK